jgi:hypothetical protein
MMCETRDTGTKISFIVAIEYTSNEFTAAATAKAGEYQEGNEAGIDIYGQSAMDSGQGKRFIGYCHLEIHPTP